jgi:hypothetical protein
MRTDSFYGNTPVYAKGTRNPLTDNQLTAKIGNATYVGESQQTDAADTASGTLNQPVLKLQNPKDISGSLSAGDKFKNIFRVGDTQKKFDVSKGVYDINLGGTDFVQNVYNDLPNNSIARDTNRNIWLKNGEGKFIKFDNLDTLSQVLQEPKDKLESTIKDITNADAKGFTDYQVFTSSMLKSPAQAGGSSSTSTPTSTTPQQGAAPTQPQSGVSVPGPQSPPAQFQPRGAERQKQTVDKIVSGNAITTPASLLNLK